MTQCTLSKSKDGTKLRGRIDMPRHGRTLTQRGCNKIADWTNIMRFSKEECKVLYLGQNHPTPQYRQGPDWLGTALLKRTREL